MNKLYFFRGRSHEAGQVVFLFTADNENHAIELGKEMINPQYLSDFYQFHSELVCQTPDIVLCFEPV